MASRKRDGELYPERENDLTDAKQMGMLGMPRNFFPPLTRLHTVYKTALNLLVIHISTSKPINHNC